MRLDGSPTPATAPEVPGDPQALLAAASALLAAGARLGGIGTQVEGAQAALGSSWSGTASAAALTASAAAAQPLTEADVAFIDAGTTLQHFAHDLQAAKKAAHTAGEHAAEAAVRATKADSALVELAADPHADARVVDRANRHLTEASEAHAAAVAQAVAAYDRAEQAARDAGARFAQLAAAAPQPPPPPPPPAPPPQDHRNWFERRLDDVGGALDDAKNGIVDTAEGAAGLASEAWNEMGQMGPRWLPGTPAFSRDVLEGAAGAVAGTGQSAWMLFKTSDVYGAFDPEGQQATQQQLGQGLDYAVHHPWEAGKQILGLEHLEQGEPGKFVGEMGLTALAAMGTGGASAGGKALEGVSRVSKLPRAAVDAAKVSYRMHQATKVDDLRALGRFDYSQRFEGERENFADPKPAVETGAQHEDEWLVNLGDSSRKLGEGRSAAWWVPLKELQKYHSLEEIRDKLALPEHWTPDGAFQAKDEVLVARIPAGHETTRFEGIASKQPDVPDPRPGGGHQIVFREFDPQWIEARMRTDDLLAGHLPKLPGLRPAVGP